MFLTSINLIKVFILHIAKMKSNITIKDTLATFKLYGIEDVSVDLLSKTIKTMLEDNLLYEKKGKYSISNFGCDEYERYKVNLSTIVQLLFKTEPEITGNQNVSNIFEGIKAFKTVPYRIDVLGGSSEEAFFKTKIQNPYVFGNRGLGKARLKSGKARDEYCYDEYAILFFNAGLVQFIGIVDSYDNKTKSLKLSKIIRLNSPLTILDVRENVRADFNGAQQKQEFYNQREVNNVITLIENKVASYGCEIY